jgi:hypothetical protein
MQQKLAAVHAQTGTSTQKRASEKELSQFTSVEMQTRLNARTPQPSVPRTATRASQKPLSAFSSKAMKERIAVINDNNIIQK